MGKAYHHREIKTRRQFFETLRAGEFTWPGGYKLYFVTSDGGDLHFECARQNAREICDALRYHDTRSGWHVFGCDSAEYFEGESELCDHCYKPIDDREPEPPSLGDEGDDFYGR